MKTKLLAAFLFFALYSTAQQENIEKLTAPIVAEGKILYKSEMASWYGTDIFRERYKDFSNVGGYFSYIDGETAKCIFFSKGEKPLVLGTMSFDESFSVEKAVVELKEREFSNIEKEYYNIRTLAIKRILIDTIFKHYKNTNFNLIPLITKEDKKIFVLTGTNNLGVVLFGNDYLIVFNNNNEISSVKKMHNNLIPISYGKDADKGEEIEGAAHTHLKASGDFITSTDICTLMLYQSLTKWKTHTVVSENYYNFWNCQTNTLTVITKEAMDKINKDQEKRQLKKD